MRVLVLVTGLVQLALYGAFLPVASPQGPAFPRQTEDQRHHAAGPVQGTILTAPLAHPVTGAAPDPATIPFDVAAIHPTPARMLVAAPRDGILPQDAARPRWARGPPRA